MEGKLVLKQWKDEALPQIQKRAKKKGHHLLSRRGGHQIGFPFGDNVGVERPNPGH